MKPKKTTKKLWPSKTQRKTADVDSGEPDGTEIGGRCTILKITYLTSKGSQHWLPLFRYRSVIRFIDMFSGIGGFREGLTRAGGFTCVGHCEIDKYANRSYNALFDTKGEWFVEDARKADPETMPEFQLLCGGFPCQAFSTAGSRKGFGDPRGTLFFELARLAEVRKSPYLLFENVPGLLNHDGGRTFATILNTLDRLGVWRGMAMS